MITKKFLRRRYAPGKDARRILRLCESYISVFLEDDWNPGCAVCISVTGMFSLLKLPLPRLPLFYELLERVRDAGWFATLDDDVISIS